jgi:hypothetical protein
MSDEATLISKQAELIRKQIEKRILASADRIRLPPYHDCFDDEAKQDFFSAWRDLVKYYLDHDDIMINIEVVREYRDWTNIFGGMKYQKTFSQDCIERADEAEAELKGYMDDIILAVVRRLYPQGR